MTDLIRRIVSGKKARFKDADLKVDLDLVYITENLIIMGYPAHGVASLYRNPRNEVRRFLESRHSKDWRIYNFCPRTENEYDAAYFYGQVSRYPFPDHHVPPLSLIPLFVSDMTAFYAQDEKNVGVIHCKAGKGRSGTMTCCYLISLPTLPSPPSMRNLSLSNRAGSPSGTGGANPAAHLDDAGHATSQRAAAQTLAEGAEAHTNTGPAGQARPQGGARGLVERHLAPLTDGAAAGGTQQPAEAGCGGAQGDAAREAAAMAERLRAVFDLHSQQRMKQRKSHGGNGNGNGTSSGSGSGSASDSIAGSTNASVSDASSSRPDGARTTEAPSSAASESLTSLSSTNASRANGGGGSGDAKPPRMGVSIPSQRRWVSYWARMLAGQDPRPGFSSPLHRATAPTAPTDRPARRLIRLTRIIVERAPPSTASGAGGTAARLASALMPGAEALSIQLGRYDDELVKGLETWERDARGRGRAVTKESGSTAGGAGQGQKKKEHDWGIDVHTEAARARNWTWHDDKPQMHYFELLPENSRERVGDAPGDASQQEDRRVLQHVFELGSEGESVDSNLSFPVDESQQKTAEQHKPKEAEQGKGKGQGQGILLDADREVLFKILLGRSGNTHSRLPDFTALGWVWLIPSFEASEGAGSPTAKESAKGRTEVRFGKDEIDFRKPALGVQSLKVEWEWVWENEEDWTPALGSGPGEGLGEGDGDGDGDGEEEE